MSRTQNHLGKRGGAKVMRFRDGTLEKKNSRPTYKKFFAELLKRQRLPTSAACEGPNSPITTVSIHPISRLDTSPRWPRLRLASEFQAVLGYLKSQRSGVECQVLPVVEYLDDN